MTLPFWNYPPQNGRHAMMKLAIAGAMLAASLFTISISAPAAACGYRNAGTAKVYGYTRRRPAVAGWRYRKARRYNRRRYYGNRAYVGRRVARRNRVNRRRWR